MGNEHFIQCITNKKNCIRIPKQLNGNMLSLKKIDSLWDLFTHLKKTENTLPLLKKLGGYNL